jgi:putative flavoprotein involved in K+ transport
VPYSIVEQAESVGAAWSGRYDSLRLHTVRWLSGLPGLPIPRSYGSWVARDDFVQYLREYAEHFCIRPEFGVTVHRIDRTAEGWALQTSEAQRNASAVVVATGYSRVPHVPDWPRRRSFTRPITHSSEYRDPSGFTSQRVLVVGAGNSAAEIASDLVRVGADVTLSVRTPPNLAGLLREIGLEARSVGQVLAAS